MPPGPVPQRASSKLLHFFVALIVVEPIFFATNEDFRVWLAEHHASASEVLVGFYGSAAKKASMTYLEALDEALCFGWIDGIRGSVDVNRFTIRFTPRAPRSSWSKRNVARVEVLIANGFMEPPGLAAYERREPKSGVSVSDDPELLRLSAADEKRFRANRDAWTWFEGQAPGYRRTAARWVNSAKRQETRQRRLTELIADSESGRKIKPMRSSGD